MVKESTEASQGQSRRENSANPMLLGSPCFHLNTEISPPTFTRPDSYVLLELHCGAEPARWVERPPPGVCLSGWLGGVPWYTGNLLSQPVRE